MPALLNGSPGPRPTVQVNEALPDLPAASVAVTVARKVPAVVVVPLISPLPAPIESPAGSPEALHEIAPVPPDARICSLTAAPTALDWLPGLVTLGAPV